MMATKVAEYVVVVFPNAVDIVTGIVTRYSRELAALAAYGIMDIWEFVYDRMKESHPESIEFLAASEPISNPASSFSPPSGPSNGYSDHDKKALETILKNCSELPKKGQLRQYSKQGTYEDALKDFEKLDGPVEVKEDGVLVKTLSTGKIVILRRKSTYPANATLEIQKRNTKGAMIPIVKTRYE